VGSNGTYLSHGEGDLRLVPPRGNCQYRFDWVGTDHPVPQLVAEIPDGLQSQGRVFGRIQVFLTRWFFHNFNPNPYPTLGKDLHFGEFTLRIRGCSGEDLLVRLWNREHKLLPLTDGHAGYSDASADEIRPRIRSRQKQPRWKWSEMRWPLLQEEPMHFVFAVPVYWVERSGKRSHDFTLHVFHERVNGEDFFAACEEHVPLQTIEEHYRLEEQMWKDSQG